MDIRPAATHTHTHRHAHTTRSEPSFPFIRQPAYQPASQPASPRSIAAPDCDVGTAQAGTLLRYIRSTYTLTHRCNPEHTQRAAGPPAGNEVKSEAASPSRRAHSGPPPYPRRAWSRAITARKGPYQVVFIWGPRTGSLYVHTCTYLQLHARPDSCIALRKGEWTRPSATHTNPAPPPPLPSPPPK